jgi:hypothetical protein
MQQALRAQQRVAFSRPRSACGNTRRHPLSHRRDVDVRCRAQDLHSWCEEQRIWAPKLELFEEGNHRGLRTTADVQEGEVRPNPWDC